MPRRTLESLGTIVRGRRALRGLREVAAEIEISPATLMRVESGRTPDVATFGKICRWLDIDPGSFLGLERSGQTHIAHAPTASNLVSISVHLKADRTPLAETVKALANLILLAAKNQDVAPTNTPNDET